MAESYTKKYINIYFFQGLSTVLGFVSLFVVMPFITSNKELYGVYAICVSLTIYFSYADLGFGSAGQKFAAESYARNDKQDELEIVGFTTFILLIFMSLVGLMVLFIAHRPDLILKGIDYENIYVARWLLIILAFSAPIIAINRALSIIYSIRLEDYKFQRIHIVGNIIKILSAFYFFTSGKYQLIEYFLFTNIVGLAMAVVAFIYAKAKYGYSILLFAKNIRFSRRIFLKVKGLVFAGLVSMICWVLYYELDQIAISAMFGVDAVATYAIAFSVLAYFRTYFGVIFSPLTTRFNYFVGNNNTEGLNCHLRRVCCFFFPLVAFPILVVVVFVHPFISTWVGVQYEDSEIYTQLLVLCNLFAFITYPAQAYIYALQRNKELVKIAVLIASTYWIGILFLRDSLGVLAFPSMKLVAFGLSAAYYIYLICKIQKIRFGKLIKPLLRPYLMPILIFSLSLFVLIQLSVDNAKSASSLFLNMGLMGVTVILAISVSIYTSPVLGEKVKEIKNLIWKTKG